MSGIEIASLTKRFPGGIAAVDRCSLTVRRGEYLVIVGPSGCGKTTLLRLIAGLERPDAGSIQIAGRDVASLPPHERGVGMIFQDFALYPHMTVRRNLAFPLRTRPVDAADISRRTERIAALLRISDCLDRRPGELSGGERQRAALGRALIIQPQALLLDEPLSHLDAHLRDELRRELRRIHAELKPTVIHVTHDQNEALSLGERIAVMASGRVQQIGTPEEVYHQPSSRFVASFIGRPAMNFIEGVLDVNDGAVVLRANELKIARLPHDRECVRDLIGTRIIVGIRPNALRPAGHASSAGLQLAASVTAIYRAPETVEIVATLHSNSTIRARWPTDMPPPHIGEQVTLTGPDAAVLLFDPTTGNRLVPDA